MSHQPPASSSSLRVTRAAAQHAHFARVAAHRKPGQSLADRYLVLLCFTLIGLALFARGFAYWGVPPLFISELTLVLGVAAMMAGGALRPLFTLPVVWVLVAYIALAGVRTLPNLGLYGIDAPRDFMQVGYAAFAFVAGSLVLAQPERLKVLLRRYQGFVVVMLTTVWIVYIAFKFGFDSLPNLPWTDNAKIFEAKGGDLMVHLAGITAFLLLGMRKVPIWLAVALVINFLLIVVSNRGGMVAYFLAVGFVLILRPGTFQRGQISRFAYVGILCIILGLFLGPVGSKIHGGTRAVSVEQLFENIKSIVGKSDSATLQGTVSWRLEWWEEIYNYTVLGPYFMTGKGFGPNLAKEDGFLVERTLRSPHNGHMTILARMGVPGAALWVVLNLMWFFSMLAVWWKARAFGKPRWMAVSAFLITYFIATNINASFDVYFEGPMGGVWYWTVFGLGLAVMWLFRHQPSLLDDDARLTVRGSAVGTTVPPADVTHAHAPAAPVVRAGAPGTGAGGAQLLPTARRGGPGLPRRGPAAGGDGAYGRDVHGPQ
ncbi:MAG: O-antigen ligase family protein [Bacteroidota bacterium]